MLHDWFIGKIKVALGGIARFDYEHPKTVLLVTREK